MRRVLLLLFSAVLTDAPAAGPQDLAWLTGCWSFERNGRLYEEIWLAPAGDHLPGLGRGTRDGKTLDLEFLRISLIDGELYYLPQPWGEARPGFKLLELEARRALFVNPAHDFPQRIGYAQPAADRLAVFIEGPVDGKTRRIDYPYVRTTCPEGVRETVQPR